MIAAALKVNGPRIDFDLTLRLRDPKYFCVICAIPLSIYLYSSKKEDIQKNIRYWTTFDVSSS